MRGALVAIRRRFRPSAPANCMEVARVLQPYLDGEVDEVTVARVRRHLEMCRHCGLEIDTYLTLKRALAERGAPPSTESIERLRQFADRVVVGDHEHGGGESGGA